MKKINFKIDLAFLNKKPDGTQASLKEVVNSNVQAAFHLAYRDGLSVDYMRRFIKIADKIDAMQASKTVVLEDAEYTVLKEAYARAKFPVNISRVTIKIIDAIEAAEDVKPPKG